MVRQRRARALVCPLIKLAIWSQLSACCGPSRPLVRAPACVSSYLRHPAPEAASTRDSARRSPGLTRRVLARTARPSAAQQWHGNSQLSSSSLLSLLRLLNEARVAERTPSRDGHYVMLFQCGFHDSFSGNLQNLVLRCSCNLIFLYSITNLERIPS